MREKHNSQAASALGARSSARSAHCRYTARTKNSKTCRTQLRTCFRPRRALGFRDPLSALATRNRRPPALASALMMTPASPAVAQFFPPLVSLETADSQRLPTLRPDPTLRAVGLFT